MTDRPATEPRTEAIRQRLQRFLLMVRDGQSIEEAIGLETDLFLQDIAARAEAAQGAAPRAEGPCGECGHRATAHGCYQTDCGCLGWAASPAALACLLAKFPGDECEMFAESPSEWCENCRKRQAVVLAEGDNVSHGGGVYDEEDTRDAA